MYGSIAQHSTLDIISSRTRDQKRFLGEDKTPKEIQLEVWDPVENLYRMFPATGGVVGGEGDQRVRTSEETK